MHGIGWEKRNDRDAVAAAGGYAARWNGGVARSRGALRALSLVLSQTHSLSLLRGYPYGVSDIVGGEILTCSQTLLTTHRGYPYGVFQHSGGRDFDLPRHSHYSQLRGYPYGVSQHSGPLPALAQFGPVAAHPSPHACRSRLGLDDSCTRHTLGNRVKGAARLQANTNRFESHTNVSVAGFIKGF